MTTRPLSELPLVDDLEGLVEQAVLDPLGTGISLADFFSNWANEEFNYPEEHLFQCYIGSVAGQWLDDLIEEADTDAAVRNQLNELAIGLGSFPLEDPEDEDEDQSEHHWEFIGELSAALAEALGKRMMLRSRVLDNFNEAAAEWLGTDMENAEIRPPAAIDDLKPTNVPSWAVQLVREQAADKCSRCRSPLAGKGILAYKINLDSGGIRDVINLQIVCTECSDIEPT